MALTTPIFVHEDSQQIIAESKAYLEGLLGVVLAPGSAEMLIVQGLAYREMLLRTNMNDTGRQNLVDFARGIALNYLGQLVGVVRLPASSALCTLRFNLVTGHTGVTIPANLRVQSTDGKVIYTTTEEKIVAPGTYVQDIIADCSTPGKIGNDYAIGTISIILDPQAFVTTVSNLEITTGGADEETDDELRSRIKLAPASFSVAGPTGAYKFFAKSASASIVDVSVTSPTPGDVYIYPLLENGTIPGTPILDAVNAICNDEKVRPLTDTVYVLAPTKTDYTIEVELTLLPNAISADVIATVTANLEAYKKDRINRLGIDVIKSQISALCVIPHQVYDINLVQPSADIVATEDVFTNCTSITVTVTGVHDE